MDLDVSIIIVGLNTRDYVQNCLRSVYLETSGIEFEVIYVDNASEDDTVEMVRSEFPDVRIIENDENKGFVLANNQGIEIARGRYILLLNSDTIVLDNAVSKTLTFAEKHPEAALVGCRVLNPDRTLQRTCSMYPSLLNLFLFSTYLYKIFPKSKFFGREAMTWWDFNGAREVQVVYGCFALVRKEAIDQVGLMDPRYFVFGDDPDWCYRFTKAGWKVWFTPNAEIIHYGGQTSKKKADQFTLQLYGAILIFIRLHRSRWSFPLARVLISLFFFLRSPYWFFAGLFSRNERRDLLQTSKTYFKGGLYCLTNWMKLVVNRESLEKEQWEAM